MPVYIRYRNGKWVVADPEGHVYGTHKTKAGARQQQKAIYWSEGQAKKKAGAK